MSSSVDKMSVGFDDLRTQIRGMNTSLAAIPEMKQGLDKTNETLTRAMATLEPLGKSLPSLNTSLQEMNATTHDMAGSMKQLPAQGAFGVAILTAAELLK